MNGMTNTHKISLLIAGLMLFFGGLTACGDSEDFKAAEVSDFTIEGLSSNTYTLDLDLDSTRHQSQPQDITLRNTGRAPLKVTKLEWVSRPDRLVIDGGRTNLSCDECTGDQICLASSNRCRDIGAPDVPFTIEPGLMHQIGFYLLSGESNELDCPTPGPSVPENVRQNYCGELLIETNAPNSTEIVEGGKARIYFLTDGRSGVIDLSTQFIEFSHALPGVPKSAPFTVINKGFGDLRINSINVQSHRDFFTITPAEFPQTIAPDGTSTWTLNFNPPANVDPEELNFGTEIVIDSSSASTSGNKIAIGVTKDVGNAPKIVVDPLVLTFADDFEQTLTISNYGNATLQLNRLTINPSETRPNYRIFYQGVDITNDFPSPRPVLPQATRDEDDNIVPTSLELIVEFTPQEGNNSTVGTLDIGHNDIDAGRSTLVTLMGAQEEAAIGSVLPFYSKFSAAAGGQHQRSFAIRNVGNLPLEITDIDMTGASGDFEFSGVLGTVAPGAISEGTVNYVGSGGVTSSSAARLISNSAGPDIDMAITLTSELGDLPTLDLSVNPSFTTTAVVGQETTLTVEDASDTADLDGSTSTWTLLARPEGSQNFFHDTGASVAFSPDTAGVYRVSVVVTDRSSRDVQEIYEFQATE